MVNIEEMKELEKLMDRSGELNREIGVLETRVLICSGNTYEQRLEEVEKEMLRVENKLKRAFKKLKV